MSASGGVTLKISLPLSLLSEVKLAGERIGEIKISSSSIGFKSSLDAELLLPSVASLAVFSYELDFETIVAHFIRDMLPVAFFFGFEYL